GKSFTSCRIRELLPSREIIIRNKHASVETWKPIVSPGAALVWSVYPSMNGMVFYRFGVSTALSSALNRSADLPVGDGPRREGGRSGDADRKVGATPPAPRLGSFADQQAAPTAR